MEIFGKYTKKIKLVNKTYHNFIMKLKYLPILGALALAACTATAAGDDYSLNIALPPSANGQTAFLVNYDNGEKLDSVVVEKGNALFKGTLEEPVLVRVLVNGDRFGSLILEPGQLTMQRGGAVIGGQLNPQLEKAMKGIEVIQAKAAYLPQDSTYETEFAKLVAEYNGYIDSVIAANAENPIGYMFFIEGAYEYDLPQLKAALEKYPQMKKYQRPSKLIAALEQKAKTQPGNKFVDFTIQNDTITQSLSDYVGKGRYTLVDFWASWCGPCIRETKVLKELREELAGEPIDFLGVAVWDKPEDTKRAIERHQLPWEQIINAQSVPTDLYGISGIPCIILFGPDGTIISRDLQDEALKQSVREALATPSPTTTVTE